MIRRLYNLQMKEFDSVEAQIIKYKSLSSHLFAQGVIIEDELRALVSMSNLSSYWETYVTTVCNASGTVVSYSESKSSILTEDTRRRPRMFL